MTMTISEVGRILRDTALVDEDLGLVLGESIRLQRAGVQDLLDRMKAINTLTNQLRSYRPTQKADGKPADDTTMGLLGKTSTDSEAFVAQLKNAGIDINQSDIKSDTTPWQASRAVIDSWLSMLQSKNDGLSSDAQEKQTLLQQKTGHFTQVMDQASALTKKQSDLGDNVANNLRS